MTLKSGRGLLDGIKPVYRLGLLLIGALFLGIGAANVLGGRLNYFNAWGHVVFTPFAILVGASPILAVIVAWLRQR